MGRVATLYRSSVGKKWVMAVTGAILVGFVVLHMAGNLKAFQGAESFNAYAEFLREVGYPAVPHEGVLWLLRVVLLVAVALHVHAAVVLTRMSRAARPQGYAKQESLVFSYASRTMRWGGVILLAFVVYHLLHMTTGTVHPDFTAGDAYGNLVRGFRSPVVALAYVVAMGALCFHLYHGIWSAFQTLGLNHPKYNGLRRPLAAVVAMVVFLGFILVPVAVQTGMLVPEAGPAGAAGL